MITAILPVSRVGYLDRVLESLKNQTSKIDRLIVVVDSDEDFTEVRNKVIGQPYDRVLCVRSNNTRPAFAIAERRQHIANIHNQLRDLIDTDWVFSVEDDGVLPPDALTKLIVDANELNNVGLVTGVELGRWGVPYVGIWFVDDVHEPKKIVSAENKSPQNLIEPIDGCGLYCTLIRSKLYKEHEFGTYNGLGPDVNFGLYCRQRRYTNHVDWSIGVTHLTNRHGVEMEIPATDLSQLVTLTLMGNKVWHQAKHPFGATLK